jgi:hypothetical protein
MNSCSKFHLNISLRLCCAAWLLLSQVPAAQAVEWSGLLDVRAVATNSDRSWLNTGLDKMRYDSSSSGLRLGQGILAAEQPFFDTFSAAAVINADQDRHRSIDLQEAFVAWNPLPLGASGEWKLRAKAGAFFPTMNLEIDYDRLSWTPTRTISASAINTWIGEEFRTKGLEFSLTHLGRPARSPHDFGITAAVFNGNDPAGTLLAWRGWSIGDRITGLSEELKLPDLPVYRATGAINRQYDDIHLFREIDSRLGYYLAANYRYAGALEVNAMHYDNRGDPMVVKAGQYSWTTRFDHVGLRLRPAGEWEMLFQVMQGSTMMGPYAVYIDYTAWYALASHPFGPGRATLRYDRFNTRESDNVPSDPNSEDGQGLALTYAWDITPTVSLVTELLAVNSNRPARQLIGSPVARNERSLTTALRWQF